MITQNVDSLHYKAGSEQVIELHGSAFEVICLKCKAIHSRHDIQERLKILNPEMPDTSNMIRPDGDVDIPQVVFFLTSFEYFMPYFLFLFLGKCIKFPSTHL